jgi:lipid A 3-O-deacylase
MTMRYYLMILTYTIGLTSVAQQKDTAHAHVSTENYFRLDYANDFFSATDRYYTQGIQLTYIHSVIKHSPFSRALLKLNKRALNYYGLHLEQDVFTPKSIRYNEGAIYYGERPFTAVFFLSHSLISINPAKKISLSSQLDLGIMGPWAKGEEEQKGIHKALDNIEPQGWQNQLSNDYVLNYRTKIEKGVINTTNFELIGSISARVGSLYTDVATGFTLRFGRMSPYFKNLGLEKNKSTRTKDFKMYGFVTINSKLVGYNATLQGGLTNSGNVYELPANKVSRFVIDGTAGIILSYKRVSVQYSKTYISPEFKGGVDHGWGNCALILCF